MDRGALTQHLDVAQVVLYAFWVFFAGLIFYIRREDRREGYPLENAKTGEVAAGGWPFIPEPKTFLLPHGLGTVQAPDGRRDPLPAKAAPVGNWPGAPMDPIGNPMLAEVGPGSYARRADRPDLNTHGQPVIRPMRAAPGVHVASEDPDPRGFAVVGCDGRIGGKVTDIWVDTSEQLARYFEVAVGGAGEKRVLLPVNFSLVDGKRGEVFVNALRSTQFADVPGTRSPDQVTLLEEEKITAYYGAGTLYATPIRAEPLL
jgi:photosynthetic reaction center H subunit